MPRGAKPGERRGGRKKGTPNKVTAEVREVCAQILGGADYQASLLERVKAGSLSPALECMLWHYAHGKPKDTLAIENAPPMLVVDELTSEDIAAIKASREGREDQV